MNSNVIDLFPAHRPDASNPSRDALGCPAWCISEATEDHFHHGPLRANVERDENNEVVFAIGGRVETIIPGTPPMVSVIFYEAEDGAVVTEGRGLISPAEAREVAGHLLRLAAEAEGVAS